MNGEGETLDRYRGSDGQWHARFRLGPDDETPTARVWAEGSGRRYTSECGGCWSGNAHSEAYHDRGAARAKAKAKGGAA